MAQGLMGAISEGQRSLSVIKEVTDEKEVGEVLERLSNVHLQYPGFLPLGPTFCVPLPPK